jgi:subtilisin family serine protease
MRQRHIILRDLTLSGSRQAQPRSGAPADGSGIPGEPPDIRLDAEIMNPGEAAEAARAPEVVAVTPVMPIRLVEPFAAATDEAGQSETAWGIGAIGADASPFDGSGIVVAVLDTGIEKSHPAFAETNLVEQDFSGSGNGDRNGHGTHCAGTIFGGDVAGTRIGVARKVERALIGKVLGDDGRGSSDMAFDAITWAVDNGAQVISMSLGFDFPGLAKRLIDDGWPADLATSVALEAYRGNLRTFDALMALIRAKAAFGVETLVVAAAGNESRRQINPDYEIAASLPAAAEGVISVGAAGRLRDSGGLGIADFSNTLPVISGPGVGIVSAGLGGGLKALSGTSMACPHVAGVAAQVWQQVLGEPVPPTATTVRARLLANARSGVFSAATEVADRGAGMVTSPVAS